MPVDTADYQQNPHIEVERVRMTPDGRMDRTNAAKYLGKKTKTLAMWAYQGKGPKITYVNGRPTYFKKDLDSFVGQ